MNFKDSLLWPLALPYGAVSRLRTRAYRNGLLKAQRLPGRIISVGNITTGGTGKTPMVIWIAERLAAEGKRVGILTRGYRGEASGSRESTSDEVQLMKARLGDRVAYGVDANRFARGQELARQGVNWFVLDDGFQHLQLARDLDVVMIDATNPFGGSHHLLPAGRLREPKTALARADVIVLTRSSHSPAVEAVVRRETNAPIFYASTNLDSIYFLKDPQISPGGLLDKKVFAFCGVGNPSAFVADLRSWGFHIAGHRFFADHHRYTPRDLREIEEASRAAEATALVCTEKDKFNLAPARLAADLWICAISLRLDREDDFWRTMMSVIDSRPATSL